MGHFIPDHFSHSELAHELKIELPYEHLGLIAPDAFWTKAVESFKSNEHEFIEDHGCPLLDRILKHDHPIDPGIPPHFVPSDPPSSCSTGCSVVPCHPVSVPEPSSLVLASVSLAFAVVFYKWRGWL